MAKRIITEENKFEAIEKRESQLWWLAVLVIVLLALALYTVDLTRSERSWWSIPQMNIAFNGAFFRAVLVAAALVICAYFRETARSLRRHNSQLVHNLAEHSRQLERKTSEVSRLKELSDQLIGITDRQVALDLVLNMAVEVIAADTASILLRDKNSEAMRIVSSCGISDEIIKSTQVREGESLAGLVAKDGRPMIVNSDEADGQIAEYALRADSIISSVIVPILVENHAVGVVSVAKRRPGSCFTEEDMGVLSTLGNQCSLVIQKAELLSNLQNQVEILARTVEELKHAQAELKQSEKLASIGQIAGGVAHEIRNPLQVILGRIEMVRMREADETNIRDLESVLEHVERISDIVYNLLSFSRQSKDGDFREVDVSEVVQNTLSLLEPQVVLDGIVMDTNCQSNLPKIRGNPGELQQLFTNLTLNAYQAMREQGGGKLSVRIEAHEEQREVEIRFVDTGPGIPEEDLDRVFEPFFTTKPEGEGTGLGLSIGFVIVQEHHGSIRIESAVGQGTTFIIKFPAVDGYLEEDPDDTQQTEGRHKAAPDTRHEGVRAA